MESPSGFHIRFVPGALARTMVDDGAAVISHQNGRVKSIKLIETPSSHATQIGSVTPGQSFGVKFVFRERLPESNAKISSFNRRSLE
jgi:hypothetical protein